MNFEVSIRFCLWLEFWLGLELGLVVMVSVRSWVMHYVYKSPRKDRSMRVCLCTWMCCFVQLNLSLSLPTPHTHPDRASKPGCKAGGVVRGAGQQQMSFCNERFILAPFTSSTCPRPLRCHLIAQTQNRASCSLSSTWLLTRAPSVWGGGA